jgi:hypothetical protein
MEISDPDDLMDAAAYLRGMAFHEADHAVVEAGIAPQLTLARPVPAILRNQVSQAFFSGGHSPDQFCGEFTWGYATHSADNASACCNTFWTAASCKSGG